jgi:hypothetical protein
MTLNGGSMATTSDVTRIQDLSRLLAEQAKGGMPPVATWNPPYCGDIGMAIKADGTWFYEGSPIGRMPLVKLFSRVLRLDEDGHHYLVTPVEKVDVAVEDAPFLAVEMEVHGEGDAQELIFRTNVDDIVTCGPDHPIRFESKAGSEGLKPYITVRARLEALVTRAVYYDLVELALASDVRPDGVSADVPGVWSGGAFFAMQAE